MIRSTFLLASICAALLGTTAACGQESAAPSEAVQQAPEIPPPPLPANQSARPVAPLSLTGRVVDTAELISPDAEAAMTGVLAGLERDTGVQFVVVSTSSLNGMEIADYSLALGRGWGLGNAERNDGLILLVAPNERKARIEVGTGLEPVLTDEFCQAIINLMLPSFREGNYADGISIGVVSLEARLRKVAGKLPA